MNMKYFVSVLVCAILFLGSATLALAKPLFSLTVTPVITNPAHQWSPDIDGRWMVFGDHRSGIWEIYLYDFKTGTEYPLTSASISQSNYPRIDRNIVVWEDYRDGNGKIYAFDIRKNE